MDNEIFFKKKQLLRKRDDLLEEIGQSIFEEGCFPEEFEDLEEEFEGMDILLGQLKDRYRALREERDLAHLGLNEQLELMIQRDNDCDSQLKPIRHASNKTNLKIQYLRDQLGKKARKAKDSESLKDLLVSQEEMAEEIKTLETLKADTRERIQKEVEPLEIRIHKLDIAIRKIQDEEDHLSSNRRKRLRALGFWYYKRKPDKASFGSRFGQLKLLRLELTETTGKKSITADPEPEPIEQNRSWGRVAFFFAIFAALVYFQRTQYRVEEIPLSGVSATFLADKEDYRVFADLSKMPSMRLAGDLPILTDLPGGEGIFSGIEEEELHSFLISRQGGASSPINFCGLRFHKPLLHFRKSLVHLGWDNTVLSKEWQALTDGEWTWVIFSETEFFLLPSEYKAEFQAPEFQETSDILSLKKPLQPFNANNALLQGFNQVQAVWRNGMVHVSLRADQKQADLDLRRRLIAHIGLDDATQGFVFRLVNNRLEFTIKRERFVPKSYSAEGIRSAIEILVAEILDEARQASLASPETPITALQTEEKDVGNGEVRVFQLNDSVLSPVSSVVFDEPVDDLVFREKNKTLITLDRRSGAIRAYHFSAGFLNVDWEWRFADSIGDLADFHPIRLIKTPNESHAVLLEDGNSRGKAPRLVLVSLESLNPLFTEPLPAEVKKPVSAAWDSSGRILFVGCSVSRVHGAFAVIVYRLIDETLEFSKLLPLPRVRSTIEVADLSLDPFGKALYIYQRPIGRLIRHDLEHENLTFFELASPGVETESGSNPFVLSRSGDQALLIEPQKNRSTSLIHRVSLSRNMEQMQKLKLNVSPRAAVRIPLSDQFWLAAPAEGTLVGIRFHDLLVLDRFPFNDFSPQLLASDAWGTYLFVSGKRLKN